MKPALRRPFVAGNWKLHKTIAESKALASTLVQRLPRGGKVQVALAPVFTALASVSEVLKGSDLQLAAQDCYYEPQGAFTGEVSVPMLKDAGCTFVIVGHSERRALFGETDADVRKKTVAVLAAGLTPIVCVGETLELREAGKTEAHVLGQVRAAFEGLDAAAAARVVVAYEPVWAIGTGRTAKPADAQAVHGAIRTLLGQLYEPGLAERIQILYGGSVKADNAGALLAEVDVDGALVGGASLDVEAFTAIVAAAAAQLPQG